MNWNTILKRILFSIIIFITFFVNNKVLVPDIMESRNLITAREMTEKGNWLIPTMNGELRLEKPPLPTWVAAVVEQISPDDIALQRVPAGVMGVVLVIFFYLFAKNIIRVNPMIASLLLCTCYNVALMARTVSWDIYTHAFMMGGIYFFATACQSNGRAWGRFIIAGIFTGLSILSKGPVSLFALFLPFIISFGWCVRPNMRGKWSGVAWMIIVALVVGGWWYLYVHVVCSSQLQAVISQESGAWTNRNVRPWWYYHTFYLETGIWALLLITSCIVTIVCYNRKRETLLPLLWMVASLILLSLLPEKKNRYLLPVLIPAAAVMAGVIQYWHNDFKRKIFLSGNKFLFRLNAWLLCVVMVALSPAGYIFLVKPGFMTISLWIIFSVVALLVAIVIGYSAVKLHSETMVWSIGVIFACVAGLVLPSAAGLINNPEMHSIRATADMEELNGMKFYSNINDELRIEMVYAARREIHPLNLSDTTAILKEAPFLLLTHKGAGAELAKDVLARVDTTYVGLFDDNRRPKGTRRYSPQFIYHATIITPKKR